MNVLTHSKVKVKLLDGRDIWDALVTHGKRIKKQDRFSKAFQKSR